MGMGEDGLRTGITLARKLRVNHQESVPNYTHGNTQKKECVENALHGQTVSQFLKDMKRQRKHRVKIII